MADIGPPQVKHYDQFFYDNIILMAPSLKESEIAAGLKVNDMIDFFETQGHNLMIFGDIDSRRHTRKLANQFGVDFENYVSCISDGLLGVFFTYLLFFSPVYSISISRIQADCRMTLC